MILTIPYKRLALCGLDELAAQAAADTRRARASSGLTFAQKDSTEEKDQARAEILKLLDLKRAPGPLRTLSMPGLSWFFEAQLLKLREPTWRQQKAVSMVDLTCIENDRFVYHSAATKMPGNRHTRVHTLPRPPYAESAIGNGIVGRYVFANVDDLLQEPEERFDFAWLDYTGPLSVERVQKIRAFWLASQAKTLVVTSLRARWNKETGRTIERHGGPNGWLRARLPGQVLHELEYQDGHSPMAQFAVTSDQELSQ